MTVPAQQRLDQLIDEFETAMLVTTSLEGKPRARPMAIAGHAEGALLYFATRVEDEKLDEILQQPQVAITLQKADCFLSLSGRARIETDLQLLHRLWKGSMNLWFPGGARDPHLALIQFDPQVAEYWDRSGWRKLEFWWQAGKAWVKGEATDDQALRGHAKVRPA
jgi:general stress protein 26